MTGAASSPAAKAAGLMLGELLATVYRSTWTPYARRHRTAEVHVTAVATVLARYLWNHPQEPHHPDVEPHQLVDSVWRAVRGKGISLDRLEWLIAAFRMDPVHAEALRSCWHGAVPSTHRERPDIAKDPRGGRRAPGPELQRFGVQASEVLRRLRGSRSLSDVAATAHISPADLRGYENGEPLLAEIARVLDEVLAAEGWVIDSVGNAPAGDWQPGPDAEPSTSHPERWPATLASPVWIMIKPTPESAGHSHRLHLSWGPWQLELQIVITSPGVVLTTDKARDRNGIAASCTLTCDIPVHVLFGLGDSPRGLPERDVRRLWRRSDE